MSTKLPDDVAGGAEAAGAGAAAAEDGLNIIAATQEQWQTVGLVSLNVGFGDAVVGAGALDAGQLETGLFGELAGKRAGKHAAASGLAGNET